jgi:hypothetical protein
MYAPGAYRPSVYLSLKLVQGIEINFDNLQGRFRSQTLDGQAAAATHKRNDKMPGRNGEFDSSVADETATASYQDGMSLGGHIGNILFCLPQQGSFAPLVHYSKETRVTGRSGGLDRT